MNVMAEHLELRTLTIPENHTAVHIALARRAQELVFDDFMRLGIDEEVARTVADPTTMVERQLQRMQHPPVEGTRYFGVFTGEHSSEAEEGSYQNDEELDPDAMKGLIKLGPWLPGDENQFGRWRSVVSQARHFGGSIESRSEGLHVFAVEQGLARAALQAAWAEVLSDRSLKAAIHLDDGALHEAYTQLGASPKGPVAAITLGEYTGQYRLRELSPLKR